MLVISTCKERLHELEFVKPITDLLDEMDISYDVKHYSEVNSVSEPVIICGTALNDEEYLHADWSWLRACSFPVFGICAGMQVIGLALGWELKKDLKIGLIDGKYHLHQNSFDNETLDEGNVHGVIYHPEVRNKVIIKEFVNTFHH